MSVTTNPRQYESASIFLHPLPNGINTTIYDYQRKQQDLDLLCTHAQDKNIFSHFLFIFRLCATIKAYGAIRSLDQEHLCSGMRGKRDVHGEDCRVISTLANSYITKTKSAHPVGRAL